jgi:MOSC domain-containing protein YiiM
MKIVQVCVGRAREVAAGGKRFATATAKEPVEGPVAVEPLGLVGDEQADLSVHGGLAKAVYAYPSEHLPFWQTVRAQAKVALWDEPVGAALLGANLLLAGVREHELWVGDRFVLPHCTLVVSEPRLPCNKFAAVMGFAQAGKLMVQEARCGFYLSVAETGTLEAGERFTLVAGARRLSIADAIRGKMAKHRRD